MGELPHLIVSAKRLGLREQGAVVGVDNNSRNRLRTRKGVAEPRILHNRNSRLAGKIRFILGGEFGLSHTLPFLNFWLICGALGGVFLVIFGWGGRPVVGTIECLEKGSDISDLSHANFLGR